jgi:hypothetical protein
MIQKQVQLNGPFGSPKMGPIKHLQTEINDGGIHPDQSILESKLLFPNLHLNPTAIKEPQEELLIEFPGTMFIGIGQGRMRGSSDPQMPKLPFTTSKASTNLTKRMGTSQLTKQHGDELTPTGESFSMTLCLSHRNQLLKLQTRKQLQQLAKYATKSIHKWPSFICGIWDRFNLPQIKGRAQFFKSYFGQD